ncbi:Peptidase OS=Rhodanobacter lindaniclasticus OX=75310 GN=B1991_10755 PE=4 SV=1 [Rhodanobacter lindaniclasticus]
MTQQHTYPVGTPGQPWGEAERDAWRARQRVQRSYANDVLQRIDALRAHWEVSQYGQLDYPDARHPLYALRSAAWRDDLPVMLVTGGVHGYETSGVHGALAFAEAHAGDFAGRANLLVTPCVSPWATSASSAGTPPRSTPTARSTRTAPAQEAAALMALVAPLRDRVAMHIDLHETTDSDEDESAPRWRPATASRSNPAPSPMAFTCARTARSRSRRSSRR